MRDGVPEPRNFPIRSLPVFQRGAERARKKKTHMSMKKAIISVGFAAILVAGAATPAQAADKPADTSGESVEAVRATVLNLIRALVDQGVISAAKAQDMLRQAGIDPAVLNAPQVTQAAPPAGAGPAEAAKPEVRVPYIPQTVKDEMREELRQDIVAQARAEGWGQPGVLPDWVTRFTLFGDMRVRYQREQFSSSNDPLPQDIDAYYQLQPGTTKTTLGSREQEVIRARLGFNVQLGNNWAAQMRVVTVNGDTLTASPVSYNVDEASYGRPFSAGVDLANIEWRPDPALRLVLGRFERPYWGSDLIFANDLSFDGIVAQATPRLFSDAWTGRFTLGMQPLTTNWIGPYNGATGQWMYAAQLGAEWHARDESVLKLAGAYYDFAALEGQLNPNVPGSTLNSLSVPPFSLLGNTMFNVNWYSNPSSPVYAYASKFRLADAFVQYDLARFDPLHVKLTGEWVRNYGFNANEIGQRIQGAAAALPDSGIALMHPEVKGYELGITIGRPDLHHLWAWDVFAGYRYLERDAVPDGFTSVDYRLGGTDHKAPLVGGELGLSQHMLLRLWMNSAKGIETAAPRYAIDTWFLDLIGTF